MPKQIVPTAIRKEKELSINIDSLKDVLSGITEIVTRKTQSEIDQEAETAKNTKDINIRDKKVIKNDD